MRKIIKRKGTKNKNIAKKSVPTAKEITAWNRVKLAMKKDGFNISKLPKLPPKI